jgi:phosphatidylglycerophosphatase A
VYKPGPTGAFGAIQILVGSGLGTGFIPIAPATFGTLVALALVWALPKSVMVYGTVLVVLFLAGVRLATVLERRWGHDARQITIDEVVGTLVSFLLVPFGLIPVIAGFLLFRFFDIIKLRFVRWFERLPGGWGIVMDDVMAGVCTNVALQVLFRLVFHFHGLKQWSMLNWS